MVVLIESWSFLIQKSLLLITSGQYTLRTLMGKRLFLFFLLLDRQLTEVVGKGRFWNKDTGTQ